EQGESRYRHEPADTLDPETLFQRVWARKVMDLALARLRAEYALAGTSGLFDYLQSFLPDNTPLCSRAEAAQRLAMTPTALDTALCQGGVLAVRRGVFSTWSPAKAGA